MVPAGLTNVIAVASDSEAAFNLGLASRRSGNRLGQQ